VRIHKYLTSLAPEGGVFPFIQAKKVVLVEPDYEPGSISEDGGPSASLFIVMEAYPMTLEMVLDRAHELKLKECHVVRMSY